MRRFGRRWLVLPAVVTVVNLGLGATPASATNPGWVDLSYGLSGVANLPGPTVFGLGTAVDSLGRALVLGATNTNGNGDRVIRLTAAGAIDSSFASGGSFSLPVDGFYSQIVVGPNGNIYLLGADAASGGTNTALAVTELSPSGVPVAGFGTAGTVTMSAATVGPATYSFNEFTVRNDGDVVVTLAPKAGFGGVLLALAPTGALDTTFGPPATPGRLVLPADTAALRPTAAVAGNSVAVVLGNAQSPPTQYGVQVFSATGGPGSATFLGRSIIPFAAAAAPDGSVYVTGRSGGSASVAHILAGGGLDPAFGQGGIVAAPAEACSPAGGWLAFSGTDIYAVAFFSDSTTTSCQVSPAVVLRVRGGHLDPTFGSGGQVVVDAAASTFVLQPFGGGVQPDGHLLVGVSGSTDAAFKTTDAAVVRLNTAPAPPSVAAFIQGVDDIHFFGQRVADNPARFTGTPAPVVDGAQVSDVFLLGSDGHLYFSRLAGTGWTAPADITAGVAGAPTVGSSPHAVLDGTTLHVFALKTGTGELVDYHNDGAGGAWLVTNVSATAGGSQQITASLSAVRLGGMLHLYTTSIAGDLIEIDNDNVAGHQWNFYDESALAGGGVAIAGAPGPVLINGIPHVYSRASGSGDLVEFVADHLRGNIWNAYDQTVNVPGSPSLSGDPIPTLIGGIPHVYVDDAGTGDLVEFVADHLNSRIWNSYDQTIDSGAPQLTGNPTVVLVDGTPFGQSATLVPEVFENDRGILAVVAADHQHGSTWNAYDVTALTGGPLINGDPIAINNGGIVEVFALAGGPQAVASAASRPKNGATAHASLRTPVAPSPAGRIQQLARIGRMVER